MLGTLDNILKRDGFIIYFSGAKEKGKTDCALLLAEYVYLSKLRTKIATNIETESYMIEKQITNLPDLKEWLKEKKKKLFILDEAGLSIPKLRFMSSLNLEIMKLLQMIRHFNAGFIGIAPTTRNIDSIFMDTDILDAHIKKLSKKRALVKDLLHDSTYFLNDIPRTSISFNSKHIAMFTMERPVVVTELQECCQAAYYYGQGNSMEHIGKIMGKFGQQIKRLIVEHCQHSAVTPNKIQEGSTVQQESEAPQI